MDQSTQVDFPMVVNRKMHQYRKQHSLDTGLKPHNNRSLQTLPNPWAQIRSNLVHNRPKSLNFATETFHRSRISFLSETSPKNSYPPSDTASISLPSLSRERTPPPIYGIVATPPPQPPFIKITQQNYKKQPPNDLYGPDSVGHSGNCRCFFEETDGNYTGPPNPTPEGLSWRRLHMSRAKLKATSTTSELLSGFAMVAMVELQINEPTNVPEWLFIMFAICTTVLVSVHIFALMISTYILPNIDAISKLDVCELVSESPHERMRGFIEIAWAFSTVLGLFLFLVEVAILCWVKFWDYSLNAAIAATVVVIPVLVIFILFAVHFYHSLLVYRCDTSEDDIRKLEELKKHLDDATTTPV